MGILLTREAGFYLCTISAEVGLKESSFPSFLWNSDRMFGSKHVAKHTSTSKKYINSQYIVNIYELI